MALSGLGNVADPGAMAFGGGVFLATWMVDHYTMQPPDVMGARFAADGTLLDPGGFLICAGCGFIDTVNIGINVAASGNGFWVIWENGGALVGFDGTVIRVRQPLVANPQAGLFLNPNIACAPGACVIVWSGDFGVWIAGMPPDGSGVGTPDLVYPAVGGSLPLIANNGDEFLVAAGNLAVRYTTTPYLHVLDNQAIQVGGSAAIAADGSSFLLAWPGSSSIYAQKVLADGTVQSPHQITDFASGEIGLASNGSGFRLVFPAPLGSTGVPWDFSLGSAAVSASDVVGPVTPVGIASASFAIAASPSGYLIAWAEGDGKALNGGVGGQPVYAAFVDATASSFRPPVIVSNPGEEDPTAAANKNEYLVAWAAGISERQITAMHFREDLQDLEFGFYGNFTVAPAAGDQTMPAAASDGTDFAVVWDDTRNGNDDIYGARIANGAPASAIAVASGAVPQTRPALASNGHEYLALWEEQGAIRGTRLASDLSAIGTAFPASIGSNAHSTPSIASNGKDYLGAWVSHGAVDQVVGVRIRDDGTLLDSAELAFAPSSDAQTAPTVAWSGGSYLVVWRESNASDRSVQGARVRPDGTITAIAMNSSTRSDEPAVGALCDAHLVAWQDGDPTTALDIGGALLPDGAPSASDLPIAATMADERTPAIAGTGKTALVAYYRNHRILGRLVTATCAESADGGVDGSVGGSGGIGGMPGTGGTSSGGTAGAGGTSTGGTPGAGGTFTGGTTGDGGTSTGGSAGSGGVSAGGSGGTSSGGSANVDAGTGGTSSGGSANIDAGAGGTSSGGSVGTGGTSSGGSANIDAEAGGTSSGGSVGTGGTSSGGSANLDAGTGGASPGDAATDGSGGGGHGEGGKGCSCRVGATGDVDFHAIALLCMVGIALARRRSREKSRPATFV